MKKLLFLLLFLPLLVAAQTEDVIEKSIKFKVAMMQNFNKMGKDGEQAFWQTKGKITYSFVNYTDEQNPVFRQLFVDQYNELLPIYQKMIVSEDDRDTALFVKTLVRQEEDYRKLLTKEQLQRYSAKLTEIEQKDKALNDSYSALFFSDSLLKEYKTRYVF
ncbi:MAG TPA: hypothetical protein VF581_07955 [Flavobacterium sp.]|jgi:hypothetical protein